MVEGFSILEIIIAFAVFILSLSAVILILFSTQSAFVATQTNNEALTKAHTMIEEARASSTEDFSLVNPIAPFQDGIYTESLRVSNLDFFTKVATSTVTWQTNNNSNQSVELVTLFTDPKSASVGDTCNQTLTGDWTHPKLLGSVDIGSNNIGTDVDVLNKIAYVTADASDASKDDFYVVDVSNPNLTNLPILGSINTGPGLDAVTVFGKYAYVADVSTVNQLQIIDISTPSSPRVVASLDITGPSDTAVGNSIFYSAGKVYLGLTKSTGPEFYVIDVSNPLQPVKKASFEIDSQINAITVKNNIAYLSVPDDPLTPSTSEQLKILDVSQADTGVISFVNIFAPNPSTMSGKSAYISKDGKTLYFGEGGANSANKQEFFELNVVNPNSIVQTGSKYISTSRNVTVDAIIVRSNLAFLWTSDSSQDFQIWDLNNLSSALPYASLNTLQTAAGGMDCEGNLIYASQQGNIALQIIGPGT